MIVIECKKIPQNKHTSKVKQIDISLRQQQNIATDIPAAG